MTLILTRLSWHIVLLLVFSPLLIGVIGKTKALDKGSRCSNRTSTSSSCFARIWC